MIEEPFLRKEVIDSDIHDIIMVCSCKENKCISYKCGKNKISCLQYCNC